MPKVQKSSSFNQKRAFHVNFKPILFDQGGLKYKIVQEKCYIRSFFLILSTLMPIKLPDSFTLHVSFILRSLNKINFTIFSIFNFASSFVHPPFNFASQTLHTGFILRSSTLQFRFTADSILLHFDFIWASHRLHPSFIHPSILLHTGFIHDSPKLDGLSSAQEKTLNSSG